jgi:MoaA/NifB/PqqE/SkfB family radical SAM enzyme
VRRYFFLRESTYDMTRRCNIRCNGCYFYEGEKQHARENTSPDDWRRLMQAEKARGITFVVLAGAEPSLVSDLCRICYDEIPLGCIATNGLKRIPDDVGYRIHISVWGNDETSFNTRNAKRMLSRQLENYAGDPRAVFVYTFTRHNIDQAESVVRELAGHNAKVTFNMFSAPTGYRGNLRHTPLSLADTQRTMIDLLKTYPETVLFSWYSAMAHTHEKGLHDLFGCSYPRRNSSTDVGLGRSFRQYRTDLSWDRAAACCVPDTDCADCRHYAAASAVVTARLFRHAVDPKTFRSWLDFVDTYLAVWVKGYVKGRNLCDETVSPPGVELTAN